jgi:hypothetical protein
MTSLYLLAHEYRAAADQLADLDLDEQTVADTLEGMVGDLEVKAANVAMMARNLEATAAAIKDAEAQMAARRKTLERRSQWLRHYLLESMQHAGLKRMECPQFVLAVRDNPARVDVFAQAMVPEQFLRQPEPPPPEPDKMAIKEALESGADVPGCRLTRTQRLEVK